MYRAVVFDLWQTLATWPEEESRAFRQRWSQRIGVEPEELDAVWYADGAYERRETGSISAAVGYVHEALGGDADVAEVVAWRLEMARRALVPHDGVTGTLSELRRRGLGTGLISNCTEDVALVWHESPLAELLDVAVFSATAGWMKPDRRIYELACSELGVAPPDCLFVGDGANDELPGAQRVGMTPVLIHRQGEEPMWESLREWKGSRITAIPQVIDLVG